VIKTFSKGGVHPPQNKITKGKLISDLLPSDIVTIPLNMHLGVPAKPIVNKGDQVIVGQLIARGDGFVSANIHSSVSGKVLKIDKAPDINGYKSDAIFIEVSGDVWEENIDRSPELCNKIFLLPPEIIKKINDSGIVGMGGAAFPTHVKLTIPRGKKAEFLIINGVECEPYLTSDHALMLEKGEELMVGITILMKVIQVKRARIGIENNKQDAINYLTKLSSKYEGISVHPLRIKYPQGSEKQLISALNRRNVPSGGLPIDTGSIVINVGTAVAVYEAVQKNKPLIDRVVTVTGKSVTTPSLFRVRIGTPVSKLLDVVGGIPGDTAKLISGGPMMGKALANTEVPIAKGSSGIVLMREEDTLRKPVRACIRCAKCVTACPMGLEPYLLMALSQRSMPERMEYEKALDCIECGSCSYICPAGRPLLDYIRLGKSTIRKLIRSRKK
jgi:Na+-translocating ferredoxin:NAD+ oxidoreductase subunit C